MDKKEDLRLEDKSFLKKSKSIGAFSVGRKTNPNNKHIRTNATKNPVYFKAAITRYNKNKKENR